MAAWFVSHCDAISGREQLVATLRRWVEVDQYGRCGGLSCSLHQSDKCDLLLNTHYKFYLSFENSLCRDYVTEKFFRILRLDIVPVVFGQANYGLHAPPHAYIDALTFPSVKALADHLIYLDKNDTAYNEYFRWKRYHRVPNSWENWSKPYCELCERLHADHTVKVYHDIHQWFVEGSSCSSRVTSSARGGVGEAHSSSRRHKDNSSPHEQPVLVKPVHNPLRNLYIFP
ncbi:alpha-(1,3)-fucosyltransferase C-like [Procambarus clarkii]|uniref:alpha-(1,3)-fucosyltransferase C-like n=1 Tax=Procambarus clarkii TaxID=6728 RepID=UPI0037448515